MGMSLPPPATLDLVGSAARRDGTDIELMLARADVPAGEGELVVRLTQGSRTTQAPAVIEGTEGTEGTEGAEGTDVVVRVPARELADGTWSLELGWTSAEALSPVTARLLVQGRRPVVLLWGERAERSRVPSRRRSPSLAQRIAGTGSKAMDAGLRPLPYDQAEKIRATSRKIAKTVLP